MAACNAPDERSTFNLASVRDANVPLWAVSAAPELLLANAVRERKDTVHLFGIAAAMFGTEPQTSIVVGLRTGDPAVIYLSSAGEVVTTEPRGGGPGEIGMVSGLFDARENIAIWDGRNRRITLLSNDGIVVGELSTEMPRSSGATNLIGLLKGTLPVMAPFRIAQGEHWYYQIWDFDKGLLDEVLGPRESAPDSRIRLEYVDEMGKRSHGTTSLLGCFPRTRHATLGDRIFVADDAAGVIRSVDRFGSVRHVFESEHRVTISKDMLQGVREQIARVASILNGPVPGPLGPVVLSPRHLSEPSFDAVLERIGDPGDPLPSMWTRMIADRSGHLWLQRSTCYAPGSHGIWQVVDTAGTLLANAAIPDSIDIRAIDHGQILSVIRDSLDVEYLAVFAIERASGS